MTPNELAQTLENLAVGAPVPDGRARWGRWRLLRLLGKGNMGWVVEAAPDGSRLAARKALKIPVPGKDGALAFEGNVIALGRSVHLVFVEELAEEQGLPYLVMELLEGESGQDLVGRAAAGAPIVPDHLLALAKDWASGLAFLHRRGWKHRDVKPTNVFVRSEEAGGRGALLDFGIAKDEADAGGLATTDPALVRGTLAYLAPERLSMFDDVDPRATAAADVYALGLTLVAIATGRQPIRPRAGGAAGAVEVGRKAVRIVEALGEEGVWSALARRCTGTPAAGLEQVIQRCLRPRPGERYADGSALLGALEALPVAATREVPRPTVTPPPTPAVRPPPSPRRVPMLLVVGGVSLGIVGGVAAVLAAPGAPAAVHGWLEEAQKVRIDAFLAPFAFRSIPATGPSGFSMGSAEDVASTDEHPQHPVVLSAFLAMEHEVTQGEWTSVMGSVPSGQAATGDRVPVANVSWCDAVVFANRLTAKGNEAGAGLKVAYILPAGMDVGLTVERCNELAPQVARVPGANGFRLPTEAEWEYLARGGQGDLFEFSGSNTATEAGWIGENSGNRPHDVCTASTPRNGFGLCDLTGNVWEWTGDWYDAAYYGTAAAKGPDPTGPESGSLRVNRGGGWWGPASVARVANRTSDSPGRRDDNLGVRLVRSSP